MRPRRQYVPIRLAYRQSGGVRSAARELGEAIERQTATSEVLQVISSSSGDLEPAFRDHAGKGRTALRRHFREYLRWDGEALHLVATHNVRPHLRKFGGARRFVRSEKSYWTHVNDKSRHSHCRSCGGPGLRSNAIRRSSLPLNLGAFGPF